MSGQRNLTDADLEALAVRLAPLVAAHMAGVVGREVSESLQTDLATGIGRRVLSLLFSGSVFAAVGLSVMHFLGVHIK